MYGATDVRGFYSWPEVNDSIESYEQVGYGSLNMIVEGFLT